MATASALPVHAPHTFKSILFPTDLTEVSRSAGRTAEALARFYHAKLTVMHAVDLRAALPALEAGMLVPLQAIEDGANELLTKRVREMVEHGVEAEALLVADIPEDSILRLAEARKSDLIVVGTHGAHGVERLVVGSVAESIVRNAECPVLTVGPTAMARARDMGFQRILVATDLGPSAQRSVDLAFRLAEDFCARVQLLFVITPDKQQYPDEMRLRSYFEHHLRALIPERPIAVNTEICIQKSDAASQMILETAEDWNADLIVQGAKKVNYSQHWFAGTAYEVMSNAKCPVLSVRTS